MTGCSCKPVCELGGKDLRWMRAQLRKAVTLFGNKEHTDR
ncbi:hypothetical protein AVEN_103701-1, partial [Araneus ventricosus]